MKKKHSIVGILLVAVFVLSLWFSACNVKPDETQNETHFETQDETHTQHNWSTEWTSDNKYHWHAPLCQDTSEVKDKATHTFENYVCTVCSYDLFSQTDFSDVGEKFKTVAQPLYEVAETILQDLVESGNVTLDETRNPRIVSIRYFYGTSYQITVREDIFIADSGEKSEFLQNETGISLENFGTSYDEVYFVYREFMRTERQSQRLENYQDVVLPYAQRAAELILAQYQTYKSSQDKEIKLHNLGKQLILSAESSLAEVYDKIVANLNSALALKGYPLITNQDMEISYGGNIYWEVVYRWIIVQVYVGNLRYVYYISFNENGEFSEEFLNHFQGTARTGYTPANPDMLNPNNEEYLEFFDSMKIEQMDLSNLADHYGYNGEGCALYNPAGEETVLYF